MSRSLNIYERNYPAVEKEATAITEAVRKWAHFLKGGNFALVTDQRSVFFMFDKTNHGKIKNSKILMWRLELRQFRYEIHHKPGVENVASDAFSRICGALNTSNSLAALHATLGHPRYDRLYHFIRARNLPFTCDETKAVAASVKFAPNTSLAFINGNLQVWLGLPMHGNACHWFQRPCQRSKTIPVGCYRRIQSISICISVQEDDCRSCCRLSLNPL